MAIQQKTVQPRAAFIHLQKGEMGDPVAEVEICFFVFKRMVFGQMPMTEYKIINFRVFLQGFLCKDQEKLVVAMVDGVFMSRFAPAFPREVVSKGDAKVRMQTMKCPLRQRIAENPLQQLVFSVARSQTIAMPDVIGFAKQFAHNRLVMNLRAELFGEVTLHPHVMVADEVVDFDPHIGQFAEFAQQTAVSFGNGLVIFKPEVKDIAHQIQFGSGWFDGLEPAHKMFFAEEARRRVGCAKVQIRCEVYFFTRIQAPRR